MIALEGDYDLFNSFKNQIIYFKNVEWNEENLICQQFKRIKNLKIKSDDAPQIKLNLLNKSNIDEIDNLTFISYDVGDFESKVTNLHLLNLKINCLQL